MRKVVIATFWNEEFLLPYWLKHHRNLFDHGIMIDYGSTDASCDIIRTICPNWDLVKTTVGGLIFLLAPGAADDEAMRYERSLGNDCYKMVLNITEFLFHWNLDEFFETQHPRFKYYNYKTQGIIMFDPPELKEQPPDPNEYLVLQRHFGSYDILNRSRSRLLHRHDSGAYHMGRHATMWQDVVLHPSFYLLWYYWSPFLPMKKRGMAMRGMQYNILNQSGYAHSSNAYGSLSTEAGWDHNEAVFRSGGSLLAPGLAPPLNLSVTDPWFAHVQQKIKDTWPQD